MVEFICNSCGRYLSREEDFNYAAFLYGVFFLESQDGGFVGTTCPSCLKTTYWYLNRLDFVQVSSIRDSFSFQGKIFNQPFSYFSTSAALPLFDDKIYSNLIYGKCSFIFKSLDDVEVELKNFEDDEYSKLFNAYGNSMYPVIGEYYYNIWVSFENAIKIIKMEQKGNVRTIPRYMFNNDLLVKAEQLLWKYRQVKNTYGEIARYFSGTELYFKFQPENLKELEFNNLLVTDPLLVPEEHQFGCIPKYLWRKKHPFKETIASNIFSDVHQKYNESENADFEIIYELVNVNCSKDFSLSFLSKNLERFLDCFVSERRFSIMNANWSHAHLWELKQEFLSEYNWEIEKGLRLEQKYFFYREGCSFRMKFNNKEPRSGLSDIGYHYLYYTLCHQDEEIHTRKIYQTCNNSGAYGFDDLLMQELIISDGQDDYIEMADDKTRKYIEENLIRLKQDLTTVKAIGDNKKSASLKRKIEEINRYYDECFWKNGRKKLKRSKEIKNIADAVGVAIKRALDELDDDLGYGEAASYFRDSIVYPYGTHVKFVSSDKKINFFT